MTQPARDDESMRSANVERAYEKSRRRTIRLFVLAAIAAVVITGGVIAVNSSEQTRECTVESMRTASMRRSSPNQLLTTAECGVVGKRGSAPIEVIDPDCVLNFVQVGSRYRMTTRGFDFFLPPFDQQLVGAVELVYAPPGAPCPSDSWLVED